MAFTASTAFLPRMWNNRNDDLQNIPGLYGSVSGASFITADADAGLACFKGAHMATGGYQMTLVFFYLSAHKIQHTLVRLLLSHTHQPLVGVGIEYRYAIVPLH